MFRKYLEILELSAGEDCKLKRKSDCKYYGCLCKLFYDQYFV